MPGLKLYYDPKVYPIHQSTINHRGWSQFAEDERINWHSSSSHHGDIIPEVAGRVCYMSFDNPRPGGNKTYIERIKNEKHGSVIEHPSWGFIFTGVSRSLTHELVRHRAGFSFSQLSQRYVDESGVGFVVPHEIRREVRKAWPLWQEHGMSGGFLDDQGDPFIQVGVDWLSHMTNALLDYQHTVKYLAERLGKDFPEDIKTSEMKTTMRKASRGTARSVLPNATETKIMVTANARSWRHFIEQRGSSGAEVEIRKLAYRVWLVLREQAPNTFSDYEWIMDEIKCEEEPFYSIPTEVRYKHRKV